MSAERWNTQLSSFPAVNGGEEGRAKHDLCTATPDPNPSFFFVFVRKSPCGVANAAAISATNSVIVHKSR